MVQRMRIELTRVAPYAPQTYASTSSAIAAAIINISLIIRYSQVKDFTFGFPYILLRLLLIDLDNL